MPPTTRHTMTRDPLAIDREGTILFDAMLAAVPPTVRATLAGRVRRSAEMLVDRTPGLSLESAVRQITVEITESIHTQAEGVLTKAIDGRNLA